ncbi:hypothetical protein KAU51_03790 [Candidatus Parcubacteria bacterium]|nr:hypothetical protein [Candidatus Parcubacteria bacterium]
MKQITQEKKCINIKTAREKSCREIIISVGKMEVLDRLFSGLSDVQKHDIICVDIRQLGKYTPLEWWKGMTVDEKIEGITNLLKKYA